MNSEKLECEKCIQSCNVNNYENLNIEQNKLYKDNVQCISFSKREIYINLENIIVLHEESYITDD